MLVVFEKKSGQIDAIYDNVNEVVEYESIVIDKIPTGKNLVSIDPKTKEPIFEDRPLTLEERLAILESSQNDQDEAINDLANMMGE